MKRIFLEACFICLASSIMANSVLVEAESFQQTGGWQVDQQFMDFMGCEGKSDECQGEEETEASHC